MKLSLTLHGKTYSVESEDQFDGQGVSELVEHFKGLLVNAGYHPESVDQYFNTEYQWFNDKEEKWEDLTDKEKENLKMEDMKKYPHRDNHMD